MYKLIGFNKTGQKLWRTIRGSNKNEAVNLLLERSMHTTGRFKEVTAMGKCFRCGCLLHCVSHLLFVYFFCVLSHGLSRMRYAVNALILVNKWAVLASAIPPNKQHSGCNCGRITNSMLCVATLHICIFAHVSMCMLECA
jgi:hypothetical protein